MRRLLVLCLAPWIVVALLGVSRASATNYPGPTPSSTVRVLPGPQSAVPHGGTEPGTSLPFTGGDVLLLTVFAAAVLVPGVGLIVVSRRRSSNVQSG